VSTPHTPKPVEMDDPARGGRARFQPRLRHKVALMLISLLVVLLGFEGFYRVRRWRRNRDPARFTLDHNWMREIPRPGWATPDGRIHINSLGFRGEPIQRAKPDGAVRIVCLGGSTTFGFYLHDDATWPHQLQQRLRRAFPTHTIEVINAACPGYNTYVSYVNLRTRLIHLQPDIVVVYHLHNDAQHALVNRIAVNRRIDPQAWYPDLLRRDGFDGWVWQSLLVNRVLDKVSRRTQMTRKEYEALYPSIRDMYEYNMGCVVRFCKDVGIRPVLCTYAHCIDPSLPEKELQERAAATLRNFRFLDILQSLDLYHDLNNVVRQIARAEGAGLVDNARLVPRDGDLFRDSVHFTASGAAQVSANVFREVCPLVAEIVGEAGCPATGSGPSTRPGSGVGP